MTGRTRLLVVGLDACDPTTVRRMAAAGILPTLGRLLDGGAAQCRLQNPVGLFVGALWISFATGLRADRHGFYCWDEIDIASYERQLTTPASAQGTPFWQTLSDAGRRVAVLDVPHAQANTPVDGLVLVEWGCHDRHYGLHSWPPSEAAQIESAFGLHPVLGLDAYADRHFAADDYAHRAGLYRTVDEERTLLGGLLTGLEGKRRLSAKLLADGGWDLFLTVFGESHAIGHQQWYLHDKTHVRFDPAIAEAVGGDPLLQVYRRLDAALGELLSLVDEDTVVLVLLSHGMGPHYDGTHLLDEVLRRIDIANRQETAKAGKGGRLAGWLPPALRRRFKAAKGHVVPPHTPDGPPRPCAEFVRPEDRARQHFFLEPNNSVYGGVRLNLAGREPRGCVQPSEIDRIHAEMTEDLLALVDAKTGSPVVRAVERSDRWYRRSASDRIPDFFVDWQRTAPIETVWSPKTGLVHGPYRHWRSGDHRPHGLMLATGPGIPTSTALSAIEVESLAPSIAARLGVGLPDIDGVAVPWLAGRA